MSATYSVIKDATEPEAMARLLADEVIGPVLPSVRVKRVKLRNTRMELPREVWNTYEARLELPGGIEARPLFWTKAFFQADACQAYLDGVKPFLSSPDSNPLDPMGHARFFPDLNLFLFFFPLDPVFPALGKVFDPVEMKGLLDEHFRHLHSDGAVDAIEAVRVKYLPEISCIVRYEGYEEGQNLACIYGKVQHSRRGAFTYDVMRALWDLPARAAGELVLSEPLGYYPDYDLLLQSELAGDEIPSDRHDPVFLAQCEAAGRAIGHIHNSGIRVGHDHSVQTEIGRLHHRLEQFKMSSPDLYMMVRSLIKQIEAKDQRTRKESRVASHGDYKYNQFLYDGQRFGMIDVEFFVQAEPAFDLGKYCGHLVPSSPKHWSDAVQADVARRTFLDAYLSVRPDYRGERFSLYEALSLATRTIVVLWAQRPNWEYTAETLIALAYERLKTPWGE
jgi:phosphotransferase family enzyme